VSDPWAHAHRGTPGGVLRLLARRGYGADAEAALDPLVKECPVLAGITSASVLGQVALGRRAGARVVIRGATEVADVALARPAALQTCSS
jgi:hypothetical protein